jgi:hypothetical protein
MKRYLRGRFEYLGIKSPQRGAHFDRYPAVRRKVLAR